MRILWVGNAHWAGSGYGEQANLFVPRLRALGHDVAVLCNYGLEGKRMTVDGIPYYPSSGNWENNSLSAVARDHRAEQIIVLHDAWVMHPSVWDDDLPPVAIWTPIDHYPLPPAVLGVLREGRIRPIAMSRFGESLLKQADLDPLYVPHGVDTTLFRPQPELREKVRESLSIPEDAFLVGMVAANKGNPEVDRKSFAKAFHAFSIFAREHEDAWLYCHAQAKPRGGGRDLDVIASAVGVPEGRLRFPSDDAWYLAMPREVVSTLYQAFDVLLMPSMGEGFGIPSLEAQASGVPVIVSDHSAMTELCGAGYLVDGDPWWDALQASFFIDPFIGSIRAALAEAYAERSNDELRAYAVDFAASYDADVVAERYWVPAISALAGGELPRAERRRQERARRKNPAPGRGVDRKEVTA